MLSKQNKRHILFLGGEISIMDEDAAVAASADIDSLLEQEDLMPHRLCPRCGAIWLVFASKTCRCANHPVEINKIDIGKKRTLQRCVSCSTQSSGGVIYRFLTGQDAPVSVLASALYQHVPPTNDERGKLLPGEGRKMLNFTDSRQNAAFFAPYLERSHSRNMRRRMILKTIQDDPNFRRGDLRLVDLLPRVWRQADLAGLFDETESRDQRERTIAIWLMQEFSPLDRAISLEGLGLVKFQPVKPYDLTPPAFLNQIPLNLSIENHTILLPYC